MYFRDIARYVIMVSLLLPILLLSGCAETRLDEANGADAEVVEEPVQETDVVEEEPAEELEVVEEAPVVEEEVVGEGVLPAVDPAAVEGDIVVAGSSTVFPLTEAVAEQFTDEGYMGQITIDSIGSGAGFERFCVNAETDIANASRAINEEEVEACLAAGREPMELRVGTDALAIAVNPANDFVDSLTLEQLAAIYSGEATTWADVNPEWPDAEIQLYSPGTDSGTFDYFVEAVFEEDEEPILSAPNVQFSEDDNVLVQGVAGSPNGIAYFGYAFYNENEDALRIVPVEGVEPSAETTESGEYPLARPLFVYSAPSVIEEKPQVGSFLAYYLNNVNDLITEVGYFPASAEALENARLSLAGAMAGAGN